MRRCDNFRVIGKPEVVIGAKVKDMIGSAIELYIDSGILWAGDEALRLEKALGTESLGLLRK